MVLFIIILNMMLQNIVPARNTRNTILNHHNMNVSVAQLAYVFWKDH